MAINKQPVSTVEWVNRSTLKANDYNPNHVAPPELELLKVSILRDGWTQPIVTLADGQTIVDGFHRWTVSGDAEVAKITNGKVPIVKMNHQASSSERMAATIRHNRARGVHGIKPMAEIVRAMLEEDLPVERICAELGMEAEEVMRLADQIGMVALGANGFGNGWEPGKRA